MNKKLLFVLDAFVMVILLALDQLTKYLAVFHLKGKPSIPIIKGVLELDYLENRGVAFGLLQGKHVLILITSIICIVIIFFFLARMPIAKRFIVLHIIFSVVIAGGIGNMIDRLVNGFVVDFISFVLIDYPIFNVADCYVVCGVIAMAIIFLFVLKEEDMDFLSFKKKEK